MKKAFTLVELSIVLVIIGLLTAGVVGGQSLIESAKTQAVTNEYTQYKTATNAFRLEYDALAGDMKDATSYWGDNSTKCSDAAITNGSPGTCNGDGDGKFDWGAGPSLPAESFLFWQHLANAGILSGNFSGMAGTTIAGEPDANNSAKSKFGENSVWFPFNWQASFTGVSSIFDGTYQYNLMQFGGIYAGGSNGTPVLTPKQLFRIDSKVDDGKPGMGLVKERFWSACTNATSSADTNTTYKVSVTTKVCLPIFSME